MIRSTHSVLLLSLLTLFGLNCKVVEDDNSTATQTISTFKITTGEIQGWTFDSDFEWKEFDASNMNTLVDGAATVFVTGGLVKGAAHRMANNTSNPVEKNEIWIMDYSTKSQASNMFQSYITSANFGTQKEISGFSKSVALLDDSSVEGCQFIANFDQFIILVNLTNYADLTKSVSDAKQLLQVFQSKQL